MRLRVIIIAVNLMLGVSIALAQQQPGLAVGASTKSTLTAGPQKGDEGKQLADLVQNLLGWIAEKTKWSIIGTPVVIRADPASLSNKLSQNHFGSEKIRIYGLFESKTRRILLPADWNASRLRDASALLHELVHYLQSTNQVEVGCPQQYEVKAYKLQLDWLKERGVENPTSLIGVNDAALFQLSQCPGQSLADAEMGIDYLAVEAR